MRTAEQKHLIGRPDAAVLGRAIAGSRVVIGLRPRVRSSRYPRGGAQFVGIICIRLGHIAPAFVLGTIDSLRESTIDAQAPFAVVVERRATAVRVRARTKPPW